MLHILGFIWVSKKTHPKPKPLTTLPKKETKKTKACNNKKKEKKKNNHLKTQTYTPQNKVAGERRKLKYFPVHLLAVPLWGLTRG